MRSAVVVVLMALLPGAAHADPQATLSALVGRTKAEVVQRLGPPSDASPAVDGERLFYETLDAGQVGGRAGQDTRAGGGGSGPFPRAYAFRCRTEVVIRDGRMTAFNRTGNDCH